MSAIRTYLDEDVHGMIAHALRLRGRDVLTTVEAGRTATEDADQIRFASERGFSILVL